MKSDAKKLAFWQKQLSDFENSSLSGTDFCKANNLVYSQFLYWKKTIQNKSTETPEAKQSWVNVKVADHKSLDSKPIEVVIGKATVKLDADFNQDIFEKVLTSLVKLC